MISVKSTICILLVLNFILAFSICGKQRHRRYTYDSSEEEDATMNWFLDSKEVKDAINKIDENNKKLIKDAHNEAKDTYNDIVDLINVRFSFLFFFFFY